MSNMENRTQSPVNKNKTQFRNKASELLSDSSSELSPEASAFYKKSPTIQSHNNQKVTHFETEEPSISKFMSRTNTRALSGLELESDSIYRGKIHGFEPKELSGAETTSQRQESTLIDKEVKGRLRKSLALNSRKAPERRSEVKTSLTLSGDRRLGDLFDQENSKYLSSGDYTETISKKVKKFLVKGIENIDEESLQNTIKSGISLEESNRLKDEELREAFIGNLREMVTGVFKDLKKELQDAPNMQFHKILKERERLIKMRDFQEKKEAMSEETKEIIRTQDKMLLLLNNLLGSQLQQNNKVKGMLIDTLMFLDKQVLEVSKIQRVITKRRNEPYQEQENVHLKSKI